MKINTSRLESAESFLRASAEEINSLKSISLREVIPERTMLVVIDIVNGFVREGAMASLRIEDIIPPTVQLMKKCAAEGISITAFADCHNRDCIEFEAFPPHCIKGTSESEIVDEIKAQGGYTLIEKNSTNGFHEDKFREILSDKDTFIISGDCTDICVMQFCLTLKTYMTANNKKCRIIIPADCIETYDAPAHSGDFMNIAAYKLMSCSGIEFVSEII